MTDFKMISTDNISSRVSTLQLCDLDSNCSISRLLEQATSNALKLNFYVKQMMKVDNRVSEADKFMRHNQSCFSTTDAPSKQIFNDISEFNPTMVSTKKQENSYSKKIVENRVLEVNHNGLLRQKRAFDHEVRSAKMGLWKDIDESDFRPTLIRPTKKTREALNDGVGQTANSNEIVRDVPNQSKVNYRPTECSYTVLDLKNRLSKLELGLEKLKANKEAFREKEFSKLQRNAVIRSRTWRALMTQRLSIKHDNYGNNEHQVQTFTRRFQLHDYIYPILNPSFLVGEVAFQVEREILAYIFQETPISYGYNLRNIRDMLRIIPQFKDDHDLQVRYVNIMRILRGYGWRTTHPQFIHDVIYYYGTFPDVKTAKSYTLGKGWTKMCDIRHIVLNNISNSLLHDILVILDCFEVLFGEDRIFRW